MSVNKLHIFKKNTDAPEAMRGFEYQKLKTAKIWLENYCHKRQEVIYCEYQDDIMQRDFTAQTVKFTQIKSYSRNLSIDSEELRKAIFNFFMLFTNPEYFSDDVTFAFETTSGIADSKVSEDSLLLRNWVTNQELLPPELLKRCTQKIKSILQEFIQNKLQKDFKKSSKKRKSLEEKQKVNTVHLNKIEESDKKLREAKNSFEELPDTFFEDFTKRLRWEFIDTSPDIAFNQLVADIEELASSLPSIVSVDLGKIVLSRLHWEVSRKSIQPEPNSRVLTSQLLDNILLSLGEDEWYVQIREKYIQAEGLIFQIGEFYEIVSAATNCKQHIYLKEDIPLWIGVIEKYLEEESVPNFIKHQARFEICYLSLQLDIENYKRHGTLKGKETLLREYLNSVEEYIRIKDIEAAVVISGFTATYRDKDGLDISIDEIKNWENSLTLLIDREIQTEKNKNHLCSLFELRGLLTLQVEFKKDTLKAVKNGLTHYEKIIPLLSEATLYPILRLKNRLLKQISVFIKLNLLAEQKLFLGFIEKIRPYFKDQESELSDAEDDRNLGGQYFENGDYLKAIYYIQKTKTQWYNQETLEGVVLSLLSLSQLYSDLGMQLAAKFQALSAAHLVINSDEHGLYKYFSQAFALGANADYRQGAWINFLDLFDLAIYAHAQMDVNIFDIKKNELVKKTIFDLNLMIYFTNIISPELSYHIESRTKRWIDIHELLTAGVSEIEKILPSKPNNDVWRFFEGRVQGVIFNDVGEKRIIFWKALGIEWDLEFQNDFLTNSIAEQVAAIIQIVLVDLAEEDLHLIRGKIKIEFEVADIEKIQFESGFLGEKIVWKVKQPMLVDEDIIQANLRNFEIITLVHHILLDFSLLNKDEQWAILETRFENGLPSKTLFIQPYEKVFRDLLFEDIFNLSDRQKLKNLDEPKRMDFYESNYLLWKTGVSPKYDDVKTKEHIRKRYSNCVIPIRLTLDRLVKIELFQEAIKALKNEGWKDWHILNALADIVTNFKANHFINQKFKNYSDEIRFKEFKNKKHELTWQDEAESYFEISISEFSIEKIKFNLFLNAPSVLHRYGLISSLPTFNVRNIYEFLVKRLKYLEDDVQHQDFFAI